MKRSEIQLKNIQAYSAIVLFYLYEKYGGQSARSAESELFKTVPERAVSLTKFRELISFYRKTNVSPGTVSHILENLSKRQLVISDRRPQPKYALTNEGVNYIESELNPKLRISISPSDTEIATLLECWRNFNKYVTGSEIVPSLSILCSRSSQILHLTLGRLLRL